MGDGGDDGDADDGGWRRRGGGDEEEEEHGALSFQNEDPTPQDCWEQKLGILSPCDDVGAT